MLLDCNVCNSLVLICTRFCTTKGDSFIIEELCTSIAIGGIKCVSYPFWLDWARQARWSHQAHRCPLRYPHLEGAFCWFGLCFYHIIIIQTYYIFIQSEYNALRGSYVITSKLLSLAKERMIVMHPLPRVDEIADEVDTDPCPAYIRQMGMRLR